VNAEPDGTGPYVLVTIPISHYCEKARWALDRAGIRFEERAHMQVVHWAAVRRAGGAGTVPVLKGGGLVWADSADILGFADSRMDDGRELYPRDPGEREDVRALERDFDARLGVHARLWMYDQMRGRRDLVIEYAPTGVPAWERRALPLVYPLMARVIDRHLGITPASVAESERQVRATFDTVADRLGDARPYLMGERFSAADLTFSALAAAVLMPPEYGVPLPQPEELPAAMAATVTELREHPAGAHALRMFREERRRSR
jgi:glutathione S-transferase